MMRGKCRFSLAIGTAGWLAGGLVIAVAIGCCSGAQAQIYVLDSNYTPTDVSADGSVVVGDNSATREYFDWIPPSPEGGGTRDIGGATAANGVGGTARISDDGSRITGTRRNPDNLIPFGMGTVEAPEISYFDTATNTWTSLGGLGASLDQGYSTGYGVSANGQHIVGSAWFLVPEIDRIRGRAIRWSEGDAEVTNLGSSTVDRPSQARAVSDDGSVIVGYQDGAGRNAAVWVDGVQTVVLKNTTEANGVSGDGNVVVGRWWGSVAGDYNGNVRVDLADYTVWRDNLGAPAGTLSNDTDGGAIGQPQYDTWQANIGDADNPAQAWRWSAAGGIEALGCLNNNCDGDFFGNVIGSATDVNHDGTVILGYDRGMNVHFGAAGGDGWIWREGFGLTPLRDYFVAEGLVLDADTINFSFGLPLAMSADGRTFVGRGQDPDQPGEFGWIVTLPPLTAAAPTAAIPEPPAVVMAIGIAALLGASLPRHQRSPIN